MRTGAALGCRPEMTGYTLRQEHTWSSEEVATRANDCLARKRVGECNTLISTLASINHRVCIDRLMKYKC